MPHPNYASPEIAARGQLLYDQNIRALVEPGNKGKYVAIDIETGSYEIGEDQLAIAEQALNKHPGAALFLVRVGYPVTARIGGWNSDSKH